MKSSSEKISVLFVPEGEGESRSFRVTRGFLWFLVWILILLIVITAGGVVSFILLINKASDYHNIREENLALLTENRRIESLARELERLQTLDRQIRRAMGAALELDSVSGSADTEFVDYYQESLYNSGDNVFFIAPVEGYISRGFEIDIVTDLIHYGIDFALPAGTIVNASADGWVIFNGWDDRFGYYLILQHPGDYLTCYGHNLAILTNLGEFVQAGQPVTLSGNSGKSSAPHLHFEIRHRGKPVDPFTLISDLTRLRKEQSDTVSAKNEY